MSFWTKLIGGGVKEAGEGIGTALSGAGNFLNDIRTSLTGVDAKQQGIIMEKVQGAIEKIDAAQNEVNKIEAASSSFFVAGWRPAVGWVCAGSLALYYPVRIIIGMTLWAIKTVQADAMLPMPDVGIADVIGLVLAMLGASGIRAIEKVKGVARSS